MSSSGPSNDRHEDVAAQDQERRYFEPTPEELDRDERETADQRHGTESSTASPRLYSDLPEWEKALRAIVLAGEMGCPGEGLAKAARKALADEGVPYEEATPV